MIKEIHKRLIETQFSFPQILICSSKFSGRKFNIEINGHIGKLHFPKIKDEWIQSMDKQLNNSSYELWLLNPPKSNFIKSSEEEDWGRVCNSYRVLEFKSCLVSFEFRRNQHYKVAAKSIAEKLNAYFSKLTMFLEILTELIFEKNIEHNMEMTVPAFRTITNGKREFVNTATISGISIIINERIGAEPKDMLRAIEFANRNLSPHISHYYLHNARTGLKENDLRKSTIDIGTALEIALTEKCESILKQKNDQKFINEILKKFRTLGGRLSLAESLNIDLGIDRHLVQTQVVELRNAAVHKGHIHTREEVKKAIEISSSIIKKFCNFTE